MVMPTKSSDSSLSIGCRIRIQLGGAPYLFQLFYLVFELIVPPGMHPLRLHRQHQKHPSHLAAKP